MDTKELLDRLRCPGIDACPLQDTRTTCTECQKTVKKEAAEVIEKLSNGAGNARHHPPGMRRAGSLTGMKSRRLSG